MRWFDSRHGKQYSFVSDPGMLRYPGTMLRPELAARVRQMNWNSSKDEEDNKDNQKFLSILFAWFESARTTHETRSSMTWHQHACVDTRRH